jgi:rhodanese-related sulfurtransferase
MFVVSYSIAPKDLWRLNGSANAPQTIDVRRRDAYQAASGLLPTAIRREPDQVSDWAATLEPSRTDVIACKAGHEVSQRLTPELRARNMQTSVLSGGYAAWSKSGFPLIDKAA